MTLIISINKDIKCLAINTNKNRVASQAAHFSGAPSIVPLYILCFTHHINKYLPFLSFHVCPPLHLFLFWYRHSSFFVGLLPIKTCLAFCFVVSNFKCNSHRACCWHPLPQSWGMERNCYPPPQLAICRKVSCGSETVIPLLVLWILSRAGWKGGRTESLSILRCPETCVLAIGRFAAPFMWLRSAPSVPQLCYISFGQCCHLACCLLLWIPFLVPSHLWSSCAGSLEPHVSFILATFWH